MIDGKTIEKEKDGFGTINITIIDNRTDGDDDIAIPRLSSFMDDIIEVFKRKDVVEVVEVGDVVSSDSKPYLVCKSKLYIFPMDEIGSFNLDINLTSVT